MCAVLVDVDSLDVLAIDVATQMRSFVDNQTTQSCPMSPVCKGAAKQACTDNELVKIFVFHACKDKKLFQKEVLKRPFLFVAEKQTAISKAT